MPILYHVTDPYSQATLLRTLDATRPVVKHFLPQARTDVVVARVKVPATPETLCAFYNGGEPAKTVNFEVLAVWHGTTRGGLKPVDGADWAKWLEGTVLESRGF